MLWFVSKNLVDGTLHHMLLDSKFNILFKLSYNIGQNHFSTKKIFNNWVVDINDKFNDNCYDASCMCMCMYVINSYNMQYVNIECYYFVFALIFSKYVFGNTN